jgi:hypothetical protein
MSLSLSPSLLQLHIDAEY